MSFDSIVDDIASEIQSNAGTNAESHYQVSFLEDLLSVILVPLVVPVTMAGDTTGLMPIISLGSTGRSGMSLSTCALACLANSDL